MKFILNRYILNKICLYIVEYSYICYNIYIRPSEGDKMAYQSLYRRFRPINFDQVVGQEHITTTLKNQIIKGNIAHAYLFSGTRGTGKTSTAKIFARAVNCINNHDGNPCNECEICRGILDDSIMDVVEMDAASNNSVDDVRELREHVKYLPAKGKYKVYIIDEVHMLSKGAFNALLKTLEEPPKHLLFILATTEPQKLPATIISRCQRFEFKRLKVDDIVKNMQYICRELGIEVEERGLYLIARNSDGAMRDALSLLDQCISFTEGTITYDDILSILGIVNKDILFDISDAILDGDANECLNIIDDLIQNGKDVNQFIKDMILHFRNLMVAKSAQNLENIIDGSSEYIDRLEIQAEKTDMINIIKCLNILSELEGKAKYSSQPRIILEVGVIRLTSQASYLTIEGLAERIRNIEEGISNGNISYHKEDNKKTAIKKEFEDVRTKDNKDISREITSNNKKEQDISGDINEQDTSEKEYDQRTDLSFKEISEKWTDILKGIKKDKIRIHALLMEGKPVGFKNNTIIISFDEGYGIHKEAVEKDANKKYVEKFISNFLHSDIKIKFIMSDGKEDIISEEAIGEKLVQKAKEIFGEEIVEVRND